MTQNFALNKNSINIYSAKNLAFNNSVNSVPEVYYVYFYQKHTPVSRKVIATETVNYIYGNGPEAGNNVSQPTSKSLTFTNNGLIFNKTTRWQEKWKGDNGFSFGPVDAPEIAKYFPNINHIGEIIFTNVDLTNAANEEKTLNYTYTIYYYANEYAEVSFYDDTDDISLANFLIKNMRPGSLMDSYTEQNNNSEKNTDCI